MHDEKNLIHVLTILEAIEKIKIYSREFDNADDFLWTNQQLNFNGAVNLLMAIGEESKNLDTRLKEDFPDTRWKEIAGMRDKLSHDYRGIDPNIVWNVIQSEVGDLKNTMIQILSKIKYDHIALIEILETDYYSHLDYLKPKEDS
jgi:uncharacterized protein with HEPN domain